jgi:HSP20 family protein
LEEIISLLREDRKMFDLTPFRRRKELAETLFNHDFLKEFFTGDLFNELGMSIRADIKEKDHEYIVEAELPGVSKEEIVVEFKEDVLTISAEKQKEVDEEKENYVRRERRRGKLSRSFYVPNINKEGISADYKDGVLKIFLPKVKDNSSDAYRIEIK